jgi:hypothetical protein
MRQGGVHRREWPAVNAGERRSRQSSNELRLKTRILQALQEHIALQ